MTVASILIVEDEIALAEVVRDYLLVERMHVDMLTSGAVSYTHLTLPTNREV